MQIISSNVDFITVNANFAFNSSGLNKRNKSNAEANSFNCSFF